MKESLTRKSTLAIEEYVLIETALADIGVKHCFGNVTKEEIIGLIY